MSGRDDLVKLTLHPDRNQSHRSPSAQPPTRSNPVNLHRYTIREGSRGIRSFATLSDDRHTYLDTRLEGYIASGAQHTGLGVSTDDDTAGIQVFAGLRHIACGWLTIGSPSLAGTIYRRWTKRLPDINIADVRLHDQAIWWEFCHDKWSWSSRTPRWRKGAFHWWDALAGKPAHSKTPNGEPVQVGVPMPEGTYNATVTLSTSTSKRPRWPWAQIHHSFNLDVTSRPTPEGPVPAGDQPGYIPVPGKGENPWDCGGDGLFSMTGPGRTVEKAIGDVVASVLRDRQRWAGRHDYADPISD